MKAWLREWIGISEYDGALRTFSDCISNHEQSIQLLQREIRELRAEVTRLQVAQYVPPQTPEPEHKIIKTQTFKQYQAAMEKEFEEREASSAI
jgi:creatinine amidohydrolase/Fe(II)-dependent formamide hydrolase-like protein